MELPLRGGAGGLVGGKAHLGGNSRAGRWARGAGAGGLEGEPRPRDPDPLSSGRPAGGSCSLGLPHRLGSRSAWGKALALQSPQPSPLLPRFDGSAGKDRKRHLCSLRPPFAS